MVVARQVAEVNARPWRRHRELQGLLRAARVKAGAMGRAEDLRITELAARAMRSRGGPSHPPPRSLAVPCDLPAAESAVEAFLEELRNPAPSSAGAGGVAALASDATATTGGAAGAGVTGTETMGDEGPADAGGGPPRPVPGAADASAWAQADPAQKRPPQSSDALETGRGVGAAT
jgi:hypothetical protein